MSWRLTCIAHGIAARPRLRPWGYGGADGSARRSFSEGGMGNSAEIGLPRLRPLGFHLRLTATAGQAVEAKTLEGLAEALRRRAWPISASRPSARLTHRALSLGTPRRDGPNASKIGICPAVSALRPSGFGGTCLRTRRSVSRRRAWQDARIVHAKHGQSGLRRRRWRLFRTIKIPFCPLGIRPA